MVYMDGNVIVWIIYVSMDCTHHVSSINFSHRINFPSTIVGFNVRYVWVFLKNWRYNTIMWACQCQKI